MRFWLRAWGYVALATPAFCGWTAPASADGAAKTVAFVQRSDEVRLQIGGATVARYVYRDEAIPRPYFCDVVAGNGIQVTRTHPPVEGEDRTDHATFHPGIWMAFGDIGGADVWRNRARVRHVRFVEAPIGGDGRGAFSVENAYETEGREVCREVVRYEVSATRSGFLLEWESEFRGGEAGFYFGDQEEMGLGVRVATPLAVENGGEIRNSEGDLDEDGAWGKTAAWCDYGGVVEGKRCGMVLMTDPGNFRPCWFHARDYGFVAANPFGRKAFTGGEPSRVEVDAGTTLRLRFGVLVYGQDDATRPDIGAAYRMFVVAE